jgi:hypothetical protein
MQLLGFRHLKQKKKRLTYADINKTSLKNSMVKHLSVYPPLTLQLDKNAEMHFTRVYARVKSFFPFKEHHPVTLLRKTCETNLLCVFTYHRVKHSLLHPQGAAPPPSPGAAKAGSHHLNK